MLLLVRKTVRDPKGTKVRHLSGVETNLFFEFVAAYGVFRPGSPSRLVAAPTHVPGWSSGTALLARPSFSIGK
jgi:hypothetical protein